ncbi:CRTAC1 family protein [Candidatus Poribacteria bacterium]|nr:CRTAC1 family protein [Candidatus Poribacteria bacterium]
MARLGAVVSLVASFCIAAAASPDVRFTDATVSSGIDFRHFDGRSGERYFIETIGSGCAWIDYDNDGWLDAYLVSAADFPTSAEPTTDLPRNRLYRNQGDGTFRDVTDAAGVGDTGYGTGVCAGDYDNDGWTDLFVTNYGKTILYRNQGDGTFRDVTVAAGVADPRWSTAAAFGDIDNDGDLDLYVVFYCKWDLSRNTTCEEQGVPIYCGPEAYEGDADRLFRNNGDGTFTDITREAGVYQPGGKGLGVRFTDVDDDGDVDIYVANDGTPNFLFINDGSAHFEEMAWMAGVDADENGNPQGSMGVAVGDYDRDGRLDIVVTNFQRQYNTVYHNDGSGFYRDASFTSGLGATLPNVSWGTALFDADNDGWLDLFIANGHIQDLVDEYDATTSYAQRNSLYRNRRDATFEDISGDAGSGIALVKVSRGTAFGDYDNDGDIDILVSNAHDTADLLRNDSERGNYLLVSLEGRQSNWLGIGARLTATVGGSSLRTEVCSGGSYISQNDVRAHFGLGDAVQVDRLEIRWPSGIVDVLENVAANRQIRVVEGETSR